MSKPRAFVEEYRTELGVRRMVAVFEHEPLSKIHRQEVVVRVDASDAEILLAIAAAWNQMASDALAGKRVKV